MSIKVQNMLGIQGQGASYRHDKMFAYGDVDFVNDNPDIFLFQISGLLNGGDGYLEIENETRPLRLSDVSQVKQLIASIESTPAVYLCENLRFFPSLIKDSDLAFGYRDFPLYPNALPKQIWCDDTVFYPDTNVERIPRSAAIMSDHGDHLRLIAECVDTLFVMGSSEFEKLRRYKDLVRYSDRIRMNLIEPHHEGAMRQLLSSVEYVISAQNTQGLESLAIEGLLCGAQPVIIDNGFYKENIYNGLDFVRYFDPESPYETITGALDASSSVGDAQVKQAVDKFSAQKHVPLFWELVKERLNKKGECDGITS